MILGSALATTALGARNAARLFLDFRSGSLDGRITFARADGSPKATFTNSAGVITLVGSAAAARFDYDPVTLQPMGLLLEEARTNLLLNSLIDGTSLSTQTVAISNATSYALSFYGTGSITLSGASSATLSGAGAYPNRAVLVFTSGGASLTLTVSGTVQYAQLEATGSAWLGQTSFIPTAGTSVTRAIDVPSMTGTNFSPWYNQQAGTFVAEVTPTADFNLLGLVIHVNDGSTSNTHRIGRSTGSLATAGKAWAGGTVVTSAQATISEASNTASTTARLAYAYAPNNFAFASRGVLNGTDSLGSIPAVTQMGIGVYNPSPQQSINGRIAWLRYYPKRLSDSSLIALTV